MKLSKNYLALILGATLAFYGCKKASNEAQPDTGNADKTRRAAVTYVKTIDSKTFTTKENEKRMVFTLFLNKEGMEASADSAVALVMQKGIEQTVQLNLMGQENLSNYMFGDAFLNPKFDLKLDFDVKVSFFHSAKSNLLGTQDIKMGMGVRSFNDKGEIVSEKYLPGIYPICLMFDSTVVNKKDAYKFTFVGMIVEGDSSIKFENASESSKSKKMLMTWDRNNKIPSSYLKGQGYYPDMNIMMLGVGDLGAVFTEAMQNNKEVKFALQNNYDYWNLATSANSYDIISLKKIRNPGGGTGNGGGEQRLKAKMKSYSKVN